MAGLRLLRGEVALLDDKDLAKVTELSKGQYNWYLANTGYAVILAGRGKTVYMHRLLTKAPKGKEVDHINGNKLDNRSTSLGFFEDIADAIEARKRGELIHWGQ